MKTLNSKGMTLVEILIATLVFVVALGAVLSSIVAILYIIDLAKDQTVAMSDLRNIMEQIRATTLANMASLYPNAVADGPANNRYQTILGGYSLNNEHITVTYFDINSDPLEINVRISWEDKYRRPYSTSMSTFKTR